MFYSKAPQEFEILDDMPKEKKNTERMNVALLLLLLS
jgi:hypothetical protein